MKLPTEFEIIISRFNPNKVEFTDIFIPNYATDTLINGNISECIRYLQELIGTGIIGMKAAHEELVNIKNNIPDRYNYIKEKVFFL